MIADEQAPYMQQTFKRLHQESGRKGKPARLFGAISSKGVRNGQAPIVFVTTGIFTAKALAGEFNAELDRVVIDEAHETIAQNPDVELGVALARQAGVTVDYMSATVDTESIPELLGIERPNIIQADKQRYPIYVNNVGRSMADSIVGIVKDLLVDQRRNSPLLPPSGDPLRERLLADLYGGPPRGHGLLIAINTISGARSDTVTIRKLLAKANLQFKGKPIDVLELSGEVNKTPRLQAEFDRRRDQADRECRPYVVIATSVVEMGVTIPTLDFVVTMDSGFANVVVGDRSVVELVPLPFNSLKQRLGRVGRRRAGLGLITTEVGAPYTSLTAAELNGGELEYEPVRTPLATGPLTQLAYYTLKQGWRSPAGLEKGIKELRLPSRAALLAPSRLQELEREREYLAAIGAADKNGLTSAGRAVEPWLGDGFLPYAMQLQAEFTRRNANPVAVLFWLVALAASDTTLSALSQPRVRLEQMVGLEFPGGIEASALNPSNELVALFGLVCSLGRNLGPYIDETAAPVRALHHAALSYLEAQCEALGLDPVKTRRLLDNVAAKLRRFGRINADESMRLRSVLGTDRPDRFGDVQWPLLDDVLIEDLLKRVAALPGRPVLRLDSEARRDETTALFWSLDGQRLAEASSAVPARLAGRTFSARLSLRREATRDGLWLDALHHAEVGR